jgi:hypothetical protein
VKKWGVIEKGDESKENKILKERRETSEKRERKNKIKNMKQEKG